MAPLVIIQLLAFSVVFWTGQRPLRFLPASNEFFSNSWPLYLAIATWGVFSAASSLVFGLIWNERVGAAAVVLALAAAVPLDFAYYRDTLGRRPRRATGDVVLQRAIAWTATVLYFVGTAAPKASTIGREVATVLFGAHS